MRVVQFVIPGEGRRVGFVDGTSVVDVTSSSPELTSVFDVFEASQASADSFDDTLANGANNQSDRLIYANLLDAEIDGNTPYLIAPFDHPDCCRPEKERNWEWKKDNEGLFVLVHGWMGSPAFSSLVYYEKLEKSNPNKYEIKVPYVINKGNCSLKEAADPILAMVQDYIKKNPGKPVNLIGTSNGGRIVGYIDSALKDTDVHIRITGIAGAFFGSKTLTNLNKYGLANYLPQVVVEELSQGSSKARNLIESMQKVPTQGSRSYKFYATNGDIVIQPEDSFPKIKGADYELVVGQDHTSLGVSICDKVLKEHLEWMQSL